MSNIEHEFQANTDRIKRLRNQLPVLSHQINQHDEESKAYSGRWMLAYLELNRIQEQQNDLLFRLLTCGLSHRRVMQILRRLGC